MHGNNRFYLQPSEASFYLELAADWIEFGYSECAFECYKTCLNYHPKDSMALHHLMMTAPEGAHLDPF
jgi:hypothetical protein